MSIAKDVQAFLLRCLATFLAFVGSSLGGSLTLLAAGLLCAGASIDALMEVLARRAQEAADNGAEVVRSELHLRVGHGLFLVALSASMVSVLSPPKLWNVVRPVPELSSLVWVTLALLALFPFHPRPSGRAPSKLGLFAASRAAVVLSGVSNFVIPFLPPAWARIDDAMVLPLALALWGLSLQAFLLSVRAFAGLGRGGVAEVQVRRTAEEVPGVERVLKARLRRTGDDLHVYVAIVAHDGVATDALSLEVRDAILRHVPGAIQVIVYVQTANHEEDTTAVGEERPAEEHATSSWHKRNLGRAALLAGLLVLVILFTAGQGKAAPARHDSVVVLWLALPIFAALQGKGRTGKGRTKERLERRGATALFAALPLLLFARRGIPDGLVLLAILPFALVGELVLPGGPLFDPQPRALPRKLSFLFLFLVTLGLACRGPGLLTLRFTFLLGGASDGFTSSMALAWVAAMLCATALRLGFVSGRAAWGKRLGRAIDASLVLLLGGPVTLCLLPRLLSSIRSKLLPPWKSPRWLAAAMAACMATLSATVALRWELIPATLVLPTLAIIPELLNAEVHDESPGS